VDNASCDKPIEPTVAEELRELTQQAHAGDVEALPRIRALLDAHPDVWHYVGNLANLAERTWTEVVSARDPVVAESVQRSAADLRAKLLGENPSAIARLLADQVVVCWMEVKYLECLAAEPGGGSLKQAGFCLRRRESADLRYQAALKALTDVQERLPARRSPAASVRLFDEPKQKIA
jgi:hypothetical protein